MILSDKTIIKMIGEKTLKTQDGLIRVSRAR